MMRFDCLRCCRAALHDISVQRALREEIKFTQFGRFFIEAVDELVADDFALLLRVVHTGQLAEEPLACVDLHDMNIELADERLHYALGFTLAQQAMVDEHTGQLVANRLMDQHRNYGGIDAAAQRTQHLLVANLGANVVHGILNEGFHRPVAIASAHLVQEVRDHLVAMHGVAHFRMELHGVELLAFMAHGRDWRTLRSRIQLEALRQLGHMVAVAHPDGLGAFKALDDLCSLFKCQIRLAVFPFRGALHLAAELMGHQLHAVADAEYRQAEVINRRVHMRSVLSVYAHRSAGEDDALGRQRLDSFDRRIVGQQFTVHAQVPDSPRDQLVVLSPEIENNDNFIWLIHYEPPLIVGFIIRKRNSHRQGKPGIQKMRRRVLSQSTTSL
ncbi:hypothetical protein D3C81_1092420 [compost metagenome]